jgi:glycosyltransferase involved in cell wall biosynthesis
LSGAAPRARYRVAFLTPEYPTELTGEGGVGSYVHKTAHLLARDGHDCTVFVTSDADERLRDGDVAVVRVARSRSSALRGLAWLLRRLDRASGYLPAYVANARRLAAALEAEHERAPFDLVQSANLRLAGLFVRRREGRRHLVRISTSRLLYEPASGRPVTPLARLTERLDVLAQRRADASYAPSRLLQRHFADRYGLDVGLVWPPLPVDVADRGETPPGLPGRYLVHFGSLGRRKGTDVVADALPLAWEREPGLRMVWAGPLADAARERYRAAWGERAELVTLLGPLARRRLYGVVAGAVASVLPSLMDNLPNTVIESLALGVPVVGTDGASIDELVRHGESGLLVPPGDAPALADALVEVWRGRPFPRVSPPEEMLPERAVNALLAFAGLAPGTGLV